MASSSTTRDLGRCVSKEKPRQRWMASRCRRDWVCNIPLAACADPRVDRTLDLRYNRRQRLYNRPPGKTRGERDIDITCGKKRQASGFDDVFSQFRDEVRYFQFSYHKLCSENERNLPLVSRQKAVRKPSIPDRRVRPVLTGSELVPKKRNQSFDWFRFAPDVFGTLFDN